MKLLLRQDPRAEHSLHNKSEHNKRQVCVAFRLYEVYYSKRKNSPLMILHDVAISVDDYRFGTCTLVSYSHR